MILVSKQPAISLSPLSAAYRHQRHPSAPPAVVVQPTRTPGLLSLSKPQQQRHQPHQRTPRTIAPKNAEKSSVNASGSPSPAPRGRQAKDAAAAPKDKHTSISTSDLLSTRKHVHRQPSPPQPHLESQRSSQAEAVLSNPNSTSDPFLVSSPTLSARPSGKLARRRQTQQQQQQPSSPVSTPSKPAPLPTPPKVMPTAASKPIPVPQHPQQQQQQPKNQPRRLSRSVPLPRPKPARSSTALLPAFPISNASTFPICDDMTDAGDLSDHDQDFSHDEPPATPTRTRTRRRPANPFAPPHYRNQAHVPPALPSETASPSPARRRHTRAPSEGTVVQGPMYIYGKKPGAGVGAIEGMFSMSSDEGSGEDNSTPSGDIGKLFLGLVRKQDGKGQAQGPRGKFTGSTSFNGSLPAKASAQDISPYAPTMAAKANTVRVSKPRSSYPGHSHTASLGSYAPPSPSALVPSSASFSSATFPFSFGNSPASSRSSSTPASKLFGHSAEGASPPKSPHTPTQRERQLEAQAQAAYFASSMFQNSPSPDELPDPLFL